MLIVFHKGEHPFFREIFPRFIGSEKTDYFLLKLIVHQLWPEQQQ
jgi:hypothetical protein